MAHYLLDTNILIAAVNGREPLRCKLATINATDIIVSPVAVGELLTGVEKSARPALNRKRLLAVLEGLRMAAMQPDVAVHYGKIRAELERKGTPIGANDLWIAAHARALGAVLVTDNEREFRRVSELRVENWLRSL